MAQLPEVSDCFFFHEESVFSRLSQRAVLWVALRDEKNMLFFPSFGIMFRGFPGDEACAVFQALLWVM